MAAEQISTNQVIQYLAKLAAEHKRINTFGYGPAEDLGKNGDPIYPLLYVEPVRSTLRRDSLVFRTKLHVVDLVNSDQSNRQDVLSDCLVTCQEIRAFINKDFFYDIFPEKESELEPVFYHYNDNVEGYVMELNLQIDWLADVTSIPGLYPSGATFSVGPGYYNVQFPGYLPLTGGELSGALTGTTGYFSHLFVNGTAISGETTFIQPNLVAFGNSLSAITGTTNFQVADNYGGFSNRIAVYAGPVRIGNSGGIPLIDSSQTLAIGSNSGNLELAANGGDVILEPANIARAPIFSATTISGNTLFLSPPTVQDVLIARFGGIQFYDNFNNFSNRSGLVLGGLFMHNAAGAPVIQSTSNGVTIEATNSNNTFIGYGHRFFGPIYGLSGITTTDLSATTLYVNSNTARLATIGQMFTDGEGWTHPNKFHVGYRGGNIDFTTFGGYNVRVGGYNQTERTEWNYADQSVRTYTNNTERLRIDNTGTTFSVPISANTITGNTFYIPVGPQAEINFYGGGVANILHSTPSQDLTVGVASGNIYFTTNNYNNYQLTVNSNYIYSNVLFISPTISASTISATTIQGDTSNPSLSLTNAGGSQLNYGLHQLFVGNGAIYNRINGSTILGVENTGVTVNGLLYAPNEIKTTTFTASSLTINSSAPTTTHDGDIWFTGTQLKIRISGQTFTLTAT